MKLQRAFITVICFAAFVIPAQLWGNEGATQARQRASANKDAELTKEDVMTENVFGREVAARIAGRYGLFENAEATKYVNLVGSVLAQQTSRPELEFHFAVLNTDDIQSCAAPGGYVFVTKGALRVMEDEAELAGVLAHEIAHVANRDMIRDLNIRSSETPSGSGLALLIMAPSLPVITAFEDLWDQNHAFEKALDILFVKGYKRPDDLVADKAALFNAALAGYDPEGLIRYLERVGTMKGKDTEILGRTHPAITERARRLEVTISTEGLEGGQSATFKERFEEMRKKAF